MSDKIKQVPKNQKQDPEKQKDQKDHKRKPSWLDRLLARIKNPVVAFIVEWLILIAIALVIAKAVNGLIIANCTVPTGSMMTTIDPGDRVVGLRLTYTFGEPKQGDVAIFRYGWRCRECQEYFEDPEEDVCPNCGKKQTVSILGINFNLSLPVYYVKRVIGVPGDKIEIVADGSCMLSEIVSGAAGDPTGSNASRELMTAAVYVNGVKLEENYIREPMLYTGDMTFEVPEGCYFLLGDNRNQSGDARYWNNPYIPESKMKAKVFFKYWKGFKIIK